MAKWFEIKNEAGGDTATVRILDEIGGFGTQAADLIEQLDAIDAPNIRLEIFSPGGYVDEGLQIYAALKRHPARVTAVIDALAASIASVIAMAADEVVMSDTAMMMIHDPWGGAIGTAEDMRKTAEVLDKMKEQIVLAYRKKTGLADARIRELMSEETWMTGAEAVDLGFADRIEEPAPEAAARNCIDDRPFAGRIVANLKHIPERLAGLLPEAQSSGLMLSPVAMARLRGDTESAPAESLDDGAAVARKSQEEKEVAMPNATDKKAAPQIDVAAVKQEAEQAVLNRINEISAIADRARDVLGQDADKLAREAIQAGKAPAEFQAEIATAMMNRAQERVSGGIGLSEKEARSFSFIRLMNAMATGDWSEAGFEREVCQATAKKLGRKAKGALVPTDVLSVARPRNAVTTTGAASTIQTDVLAQSFIELLRNKMVVRQLGATVLGGLQGNVSIPRLSGGATSYWVAEGAAPTQSQQTFDAVTLAPNGVAAETQVTTQTLIQSSIDMEAMIRNDLATVIALAIDAACINGAGGAEPTGILNTAGIGSVVVGGVALSNADPLIDLETAVATANADVGNLRYLTNAHVVGELKKLKTTTGEYIFNNGSDEGPNFVGSVNGYGVARSNQVPANLGAGANQSALIFGNWADLVIGEWGALDLQVDPYTGGVGNVKVKALQFVDCAVRHPESFAAITDIV